MGDKAGANDLKPIRRRVFRRYRWFTSRLEENKLTSWKYAHNRLNHRSAAFLPVVHEIWERKHFNFGNTAAVALMFLTTPPFLGEMLEFLL